MHKVQLYQENNELQLKDAWFCLENFAPKFHWKEVNNRVIDIGSGDGSLTKALKKIMPDDFKILGCDMNPDMVEHAIENHQDDQINFKVLDIVGEIPEDMKGGFDHVFSFYTLHWVKNQELAYTNILDLLEPGGECFLVYLVWHPAYEVFRKLSRLEKWRTWLSNCENYISPYYDVQCPAVEIREMMERIGFVNHTVCCKKMSYAYANMDHYRKSMAAIIPFKIPKEKRDEFMDEFMEQLTRITNSKESFNYKLIVIYGQKSINKEKEI